MKLQVYKFKYYTYQPSILSIPFGPRQFNYSFTFLKEENSNIRTRDLISNLAQNTLNLYKKRRNFILRYFEKLELKKLDEHHYSFLYGYFTVLGVSLSTESETFEIHFSHDAVLDTGVKVLLECFNECLCDLVHTDLVL